MLYNWDAEVYRRSSPQQLEWAGELLGKLALAGHEAVVDLGCGDGRGTAMIAALVPHGSVLGIDSSPDMIRLACEQFPPRAHSNLTFECRDARKLDYEARFDVVFSNAALHWAREPRTVLRGIARSLRPGGRILLQMGGRGNAADMLAVVESVTRAALWRQYFEGLEFPWGFYGSDEYRGWVSEVGLDPARVVLFEKDMLHDGAAGLEGWFRTTWMPYTSRIPAPERQTFTDEIVNTYVAAHPPDAEGRVHVRMVRLEVEARKP